MLPEDAEPDADRTGHRSRIHLGGAPTGHRPALALLEILRGEGVDRVFGNPGRTELPFLAPLPEAADAPEHGPGIHEGAVVAMADGYARGTGRPAFVSLHIAAGLANGLTGLRNARRSRTPLVVMAGRPERRAGLPPSRRATGAPLP